ncbi:hypothetical protein [Dactylosporangium sp. NPDC051484]|uniref:hypothetical protein n=1 Tax=Dactylosporangium sp. NPDC051484 TaxID=3154942 RepID=UPI00344B6CA8
MNDDDATRDGLPGFIYGEYTGEIRLPDRPEPDEDDAAPGPMDRRTKIRVAGGGLALLFIIGLVVAALSTGGAVDTPSTATPESPVASSAAEQPSPTESPEPEPSASSPSPSMAPSDLGEPGDPTTTVKPTKTTKPVTTQPTTPAAHPSTPKVPTITFKPPLPSRHG